MAEAGVSTNIDLGTARILPRLSFGTTTHWTKGYTDTGGLTVGRQKEKLGFIGLELGSETALNDQIMLKPFAGLWTARSIGDATTNASFSGTAFSATADNGGTLRRGYAGLGWEYQMDATADLFGRVEVGYDSEETLSGALTLGLRMRF